MASDFKTGSYQIAWPDGAMGFVRIEGNYLVFFDNPKDQLLGTLRVDLPRSGIHMPNRDDETWHRIDGKTLQLKTAAGETPLTLILE